MLQRIDHRQMHYNNVPIEVRSQHQSVVNNHNYQNNDHGCHLRSSI